jgi:ribosome-binding factor A
MEKRSRSRRGSATNKGVVRTHRLEELLREELGSLLDGEVRDRRLEGARVTRVELSPDGARARVGYTTPAAFDEGADRAFERAKGFLRCRLCDALDLQRVPDLGFCRDPAGGAEDAIHDPHE